VRRKKLVRLVADKTGGGEAAKRERLIATILKSLSPHSKIRKGRSKVKKEAQSCNSKRKKGGYDFEKEPRNFPARGERTLGDKKGNKLRLRRRNRSYGGVKIDGFGRKKKYGSLRGGATFAREGIRAGNFRYEKTRIPRSGGGCPSLEENG